ncbi:MAG: hypothetical protein KF812_08315 [Fimbriimonadaceae bacterium]|nr:hypothetical protein [Fimbriimonadaceae bacterium]
MERRRAKFRRPRNPATSNLARPHSYRLATLRQAITPDSFEAGNPISAYPRETGHIQAGDDDRYMTFPMIAAFLSLVAIVAAWELTKDALKRTEVRD